LAQNLRLEGTITSAPNRQLILTQYNYGEQTIVDTTFSDETGYFAFTLPDTLNPGMLGLFGGQNIHYELIFNDEPIRFISTGSTQNDQISFIESDENKIYYDYVFKKTENIYKINLLNSLIKQYPKDDPFYKRLTDEYTKLSDEIDSTVMLHAKQHPDFLAVKYMLSDRPAIPPPGLSTPEETEWLKKHFWDHVDFSDSSLINSSILSSKVVAYLQLFQADAQTPDEAQDLMKPALDTLLEKTTLNGKVYGWLLQYLVNGFESVGYDKLLIYLNDVHAAENICESKTRKTVEEKLKMAKTLAIGAIAPDFTAKDLNGKTIKLHQLKANRIVLVFWASWCPHCVKEALPVLKKLYHQPGRNFEVVAISVDENIKNVQQAVNEYGYDWITIAEGKGWDGDIPLLYGISATPTFFVLDQNKKI
jgi:thiol-disulfide isomerase/thioredoxin